MYEETGNRYGRLTVECFSHLSRRKLAMWQCRCDCGKVITTRGSSLRTGHTQSCGCHKVEVARLKETEPGHTACRAVYNIYKANAKRRRLEFSISREDFTKLISNDCFYCGSPPSNVHTLSRGNGSYTYNGIDRLDNLKGYYIDNVVSCCSTCNLMKRKMDISEFITHIEKIVNRLKGGN